VKQFGLILVVALAQAARAESLRDGVFVAIPEPFPELFRGGEGAFSVVKL
jgi:hypothetical protein